MHHRLPSGLHQSMAGGNYLSIVTGKNEVVQIPYVADQPAERRSIWWLSTQTGSKRFGSRRRETCRIVMGDLMALAKRSRRGLASMHGLIAAIAIARDLTLATRNTKDFEGFGIDIINPWNS
jgi:hypothetical protein